MNYVAQRFVSYYGTDTDNDNDDNDNAGCIPNKPI